MWWLTIITSHFMDKELVIGGEYFWHKEIEIEQSHSVDLI